MADKTQNFANHAQYIPLYHFFTSPLALIFVIWSVQRLISNPGTDTVYMLVGSLALFGAGTDSGTFDYFTDAINGEEGASRTDYTPTEDDNVTVQGVSGSEGGLGYFGFTYYEENADKLTAVQIDSGAGCVAPSVETAQDGTYTPLARPLFIYPSKQALAKPEVKAFFDYYVANDSTIAADALFIPLNEEQKAKLQSDYAALTGS